MIIYQERFHRKTGFSVFQFTSIAVPFPVPFPVLVPVPVPFLVPFRVYGFWISRFSIHPKQEAQISFYAVIYFKRMLMLCKMALYLPHYVL